MPRYSHAAFIGLTLVMASCELYADGRDPKGAGQKPMFDFLMRHLLR